MTVIIQGHTYQYETEKVCRIFYPTEKILFVTSADRVEKDEKRLIYTEVGKTDNALSFFCRADIDGKVCESRENALSPSEDFDSYCEKRLARVMVKALTAITGIVPPWGILTGVRPSKLMRGCIQTMGNDGAKNYFGNDLSVSEKKTEMAFSVAKAEEKGIALSSPESFSLYVSVPFCPTRCSYCSFVSHSIGQAKKLIPDYVKLLCEEIRETAKLTKQLGLRLETVYFGGGTPTSLCAGDLDTVLKTVNDCFSTEKIREFTVEAGRPDTVDAEKLAVLKQNGVNRISINPQTFSDEVLKAIGRNHTVADFYEKYRLARQMGFENINMDLIAGLPGDTPAGFCNSLDTAVSLSPENITVHTLALKRSSSLVTEKETDRICRETAFMVDYADINLTKAGFFPYYMYRQSKSVGNLENVGWCKPEKECLYNIYMMEEIHSVFAVGGGAVTKLKAPFENKIERIFNFKYPYEYVSRFEELLQRKEAIVRFYTENAYRK